MIYIITVGIISLLFLYGLQIMLKVNQEKSMIRCIFLKFLCWLVWLLVMFPFLLATLMTHRVKMTDTIDPMKAFKIPFETVTLNTKDHLHLDAWYIPNSQSRKAVVIAHGVGADKTNFIDVARLWHDLGFNVMIFDFRGHGKSEGDITSLGYRERLDVRAAVDYLSDRKGVDPKEIIGYGVSFGGAAMIFDAAQDRRIKKLIIDSSFANIDDMANQTVNHMMGGFSWLTPWIKSVGFWWINLELGYDLRSHNPQDAIQQLDHQPILIMHGKGDPLINWHQSELLFNNAHKPKRFHIFNTDQHYGTFYDAQYVPLIVDFLKQ